jgi:DNA repair exonuclease SbcCD ATPase subunit
VKLKSISEETKKSFDDITFLLRNYKQDIDRLTQKKDSESGSTNVNIQEFEKAIIELEEKKTTSVENQTTCKERELYYKELSKIFGEDGVKKTIISWIIKPINHFIQENIRKMNLTFQVKLDETFTAEIKQLGNVIEHDTLSTGETKKVNLCILIAYLKLIRTKKHINILFLDEVFSSMDLESCESILNLLKSFANDYKINIFVVHHAVLNQEIFDRILQINKDVFTSINEVSLEEEIEPARIGHYSVL